MPLNVKILGNGDTQTPDVGANKGLYVSQVIPDVPPVGKTNRLQYSAVFLGDQGGDSGTTSLNVDGSVTPKTFYFSSQSDYDIIINRIALLIVDGSIAYNKFGAVPSLTNGFTLTVEESRRETNLITNAKTTGELVAAVGKADSFTTLSNYNADNDDAFLLDIPLAYPNTFPSGVRIGRGTLDQIKATVSDDLSGLSDFTICAIGDRHYPVNGD